MDSVTQVLLGAAVGHATLGRRVGRRALLWGAVLGLAPDLDVFLPQPDAVSAVTEHRGFSHSLLVHAALAPAIGVALARLYRGAGAGAVHWSVLAWLALATHALLDAFTVYGTQLLWPLSGPPVGLGSIFIIDPLYTLPLLVAVLWVATRRPPEASRVRASVVALALSGGYLAVTAGLQHHVRGVAVASAGTVGLGADRVLVTPTPFNALLWRIVVMGEDGYAEGYHSLLAPAPAIAFARYPSDTAALDPLADAAAVRRLGWFTKGFQRVDERGGDIVVTDLRMGFEPKYVFSFVVGRRDGEQTRPVPSRRGPVLRPSLADLDAIWSRLLERP